MEENIYYTNAKEAIDEFITNESEDISKKLQNQLINFIPSMCNYEEEGAKIKPTILFTNNIDAIVRAVPDAYKCIMFEDENENMFQSRMKSLAVFCKAEWCIFVNIKENLYQYGICKALNSIKEKRLENLLLESETLKERNKFFAFLVFPLSSYSITLSSLKQGSININFTLDTKKNIYWREEIMEFIDASFSKLRTTKKKLIDIKTMYLNIFDKALRNISGAICVVIDKDYVDKGLLSDGIWLKDPIEFSKMFLQSKSYSEQKLMAFSDLFMNMLNYDGITVIDNLGRIRAYNVFVETTMNNQKNILGGARKRAAYTIVNTKVKKVIGVYFQSHEGEMFYTPVRKNKGEK